MIIIIDRIYIALFWRSLKDALHHIEYTVHKEKEKKENKIQNKFKMRFIIESGLVWVGLGFIMLS